VADDPASLEHHPARQLAARWSSYLQHDRRRSAHTVRAYTATAHRFIEFLGRYRGEQIDPIRGDTELDEFLASVRASRAADLA
jgi:integrase/recombinase XerC